MNKDLDVSRHCSRGNLRDRLNAALAEDGIDPSHPSIEAEIANQLEIDASDQILDIGSGIGGQRVTLRIALGAKSPGSA